MKKTNLPYRISSPILHIVSPNILPLRPLQADHILQIFHHGSTEIQGEISPIVVASSVPALISTTSMMDTMPMLLSLVVFVQRE